MESDKVSQLLSRAEANCLLSLSLYGLLTEAGQIDLARLVWMVYNNSSLVAEICGDELEVEAKVV